MHASISTSSLSPCNFRFSPSSPCLFSSGTAISSLAPIDIRPIASHIPPFLFFLRIVSSTHIPLLTYDTKKNAHHEHCRSDYPYDEVSLVVHVDLILLQYR